MEGFTEPIKAACKEKGIEYKGCFDCQGVLVESIPEAVEVMQRATEDLKNSVILPEA